MILPLERILGTLVKFFPERRILEVRWATRKRWHNTLNNCIIILEHTVPPSRVNIQDTHGNLSQNLSESKMGWADFKWWLFASVVVLIANGKVYSINI